MIIKKKTSGAIIIIIINDVILGPDTLIIIWKQFWLNVTYVKFGLRHLLTFLWNLFLNWLSCSPGRNSHKSKSWKNCHYWQSNYISLTKKLFYSFWIEKGSCSNLQICWSPRMCRKLLALAVNLSYFFFYRAIIIDNDNNIENSFS